MRGLVVLLIVPMLAGCSGGDPTPQGWAIATTHPLAAQAGAAVLAAGGNAFDAAAVVQFMLNVVEPGMSGIGGGAFFVGYVAATGEFLVLDGRETAPAALPPDAFADGGGLPPAMRGTAVGVPGTLALWDEVLSRLGTIDLARAMEPGRAVAAGGFPVDAHLARYVQQEEEKLRSWPASAQLYYPGSVCVPTQAALADTHPSPRCLGGAPLRVGDTLVQPDLARTYWTLQSGGLAAFYDGEMAQAIVDTVAERDGVMTRDDLRDYRVVPRQPTRIGWDGHEVVTFPAPGGGLVVAQALGILAPFGLARMEEADRVHVLAETLSLVYADRGAYEADPAFVPQPERGLLHPDYLTQRRALIDMGRVSAVGPGDPWAFETERPDGPSPSASGATTDARSGPDAEAGGAAPGRPPHPAPASSIQARSQGPPAVYEGDHTTHFVVVDRAGNIASVTSTIESVFGSGMIVPGWGFFLNNEMTDFSSDPDAANAPAGGKRARSSMSPTIILQDGAPIMALGASGGPRIIPATLQVILSTLELGMPLEQAIAAPRIHSPDASRLWHEGLTDRTAAALASRGHQVQAWPGHIANVQAAQVVGGQWTAAADDRAAPGGVCTARGCW